MPQVERRHDQQRHVSPEVDAVGEVDQRPRAEDRLLNSQLPIEPQALLERENVAGALKRLSGAIGDRAAHEVIDQRRRRNGAELLNKWPPASHIRTVLQAAVVSMGLAAPAQRSVAIHRGCYPPRLGDALIGKDAHGHHRQRTARARG